MQLQMTSLFPRNTWKPNPWVVVAVLIKNTSAKTGKCWEKPETWEHMNVHTVGTSPKAIWNTRNVCVFCSRELPWNRNRWVQSSRHHAYRLITSKQVSLHDRFWIRSVGRPYLIHDRKNDHSACDHSYKKNAQLPVCIYIHVCIYR